MSVTDTLSQSWTGSGNGTPFSGSTYGQGAYAAQVIASLALGAVAQAEAFSISHTALQEFVAGSGTQPATMTVNAQAQYVFTISSGTAPFGGTYTNNGHTYTVIQAISSQTTLLCVGTGTPGASGTLTEATGGGGNLTFSAVATPILNVNLLPYQIYAWFANGYFANPLSADLVTLYFTSTYNFQATAGTANIGDVYSNNSQDFVVLGTTPSGWIVCVGNGAPLTAGTLTQVSGGGSSTITFSNVNGTGSANINVRAVRT